MEESEAVVAGGPEREIDMKPTGKGSKFLKTVDGRAYGPGILQWKGIAR
jgi:hypothetical protein